MSKQIEIVEAFTGYPEDRPRAFAAGEILNVPDDVPADFAQLVVNKRHARWAKPAAKQEKVS